MGARISRLGLAGLHQWCRGGGGGKRRRERWVKFAILFPLPHPAQLSLYPFGIVDFKEGLPRLKWVKNHWTWPTVTSLLELRLPVVALEEGFEYRVTW